MSRGRPCIKMPEVGAHRELPEGTLIEEMDMPWGLQSPPGRPETSMPATFGIGRDGYERPALF